MSITSKLFQKAVKVLRGSKKRASTAPVAAADNFSPPILLEKMEPRLLMSTVTIDNISNATEGGADGVIRITRDDTLGDLIVKFSRKGTATFGATKDYTLSDGVNNLTTSVVIPDGAAFVDILVVPNDDLAAELTETVILNLSTSSAYDLEPDFTLRTAQINLIDNEPIVSIAASDPTSAESGTPATETATFTITRAGNTTGDLLVNFKRTGNAKLNKDYVLTVDGNPLTTTSVIIPDGVASVDVVVVPIDDLKFQETRTVGLSLKSSTTYTLGAIASANATIEDNEPLIFVDPAVATPPSDSITTADGLGADTYVRDGLDSDDPHDNELLQVRNATGVPEADSRKAYVSFDLSQLAFENYSNAVLTLTLMDFSGDSNPNTNWKFNVFALVEGFTPPADSNEQGEDWNEGITYEDAPINVANGGRVDTSTDRENAYLKGPIGSFSIVGTGTVGQTVSIGGQLLADYLNTEDDGTDGNRFVTFIIVRENLGNTATEDIVHMFDSRDDGQGDVSTMPTLTVFGQAQGLIIPEGSNDQFARIFRQGNSVGDVTVNFSVSGTAKLGIDYILSVDGAPITKSFVIPTGADFIDIDILPIDDDLFEIDETIRLTLRSSDTYVLTSNNTVVDAIITDNEAVITVEATDEDAREPDFSDPNLNRGVFTLTRTGGDGGDLMVNISFSGTAGNGLDFLSIPRQVVIPAGSDTLAINIDPIADTIPEGAESVRLTILPGADYGINWEISGSRTSTGASLGPFTFAAASLKQAREVAKAQGIAGPDIDPENQSATITILNGNADIAPDLIASLFNITTKSLDTNVATTSLGTVTVRNVGGQLANTFNVRFVLSSDRTLGNGDDFELSTLVVNGLGAFKSTNVSVVIDSLAGLAAGNYFLFVEVDVDGFVLETVEDNNTNVTYVNDIVVTN